MRLQVFDIRYCYYRLLAALMSQYQRPTTQRSNSSTASADYDEAERGPTPKTRRQSSCDLGSLERMCNIYVSFVEGWGPDYPNRPTIQSSPCWLEVLILRGLALKELLVDYFRLDGPALEPGTGEGAGAGAASGAGAGTGLSASVASASAPATAFTVQSPVSPSAVCSNSFLSVSAAAVSTALNLPQVPYSSSPLFRLHG